MLYYSHRGQGKAQKTRKENKMLTTIAIIIAETAFIIAVFGFAVWCFFHS